ncbi:hypothetical protein [Fodinibius halophilus]|uniref:Uncharacterized protein n=1 Tax=Fodinibius halophilus TaxID=1736908 RepID=A0A6M1T0G6_9BACT|nr:hypothetical protein [Fodinibius halophilus]NGP88976.1 hypothetical protein [Fodinibius halophilus]
MVATANEISYEEHLLVEEGQDIHEHQQQLLYEQSLKSGERIRVSITESLRASKHRSSPTCCVKHIKEATADHSVE